MPVVTHLEPAVSLAPPERAAAAAVAGPHHPFLTSADHPQPPVRAGSQMVKVEGEGESKTEHQHGEGDCAGLTWKSAERSAEPCNCLWLVGFLKKVAGGHGTHRSPRALLSRPIEGECSWPSQFSARRCGQGPSRAAVEEPALAADSVLKSNRPESSKLTSAGEPSRVEVQVESQRSQVRFATCSLRHTQ